MNIQETFRQQLLEQEIEQLLQEGMLDSALKKAGEALVKFLKLREKRAVAIKLIENLSESIEAWRFGELNPNNPNYNEEADKLAWKTLYDVFKLLSFAGINTLLNYFSFGTGFVAGFAFTLFRKHIPQKIIKYFKLTAEKGVDKIEELAGLFEDMSYWYVGDATQDEFQMGR